MNNAFMLGDDESRDLVQKAIETRVPGILSYMSKNKWHVARIVMADIRGRRLHIEVLQGQAGHQPINIQTGQPVGVSFKYSYGKFLFDALVESFEPSADPSKGGVIVVACPDQVEVIQRRSYYRVNVPASLKVNVAIWHRSGKSRPDMPIHQYYQGRLVDLSAGGAQIAMECPPQESADLQRQDFKKGQYIGVRFTPLPFEMPVSINAQIRNILPTADGSTSCLGLQLVGLEASHEGRQILSRIASIVDQYYQMNQGTGVAPMRVGQGGPETFTCPQPAQPVMA